METISKRREPSRDETYQVRATVELLQVKAFTGQRPQLLASIEKVRGPQSLTQVPFESLYGMLRPLAR